MEDDIERLKSVSSLEEVMYIRPPEMYFNNNYEAAIVTIDMPIESANQMETANPLSSQPMDIVVVNGGDRLIFAFVRKGNTADFLNTQADNIVKSIELLNPK